MCSGLPGAHYMLVEMLGALPTRVVHSVQMAVGLCLPKAGSGQQLAQCVRVSHMAAGVRADGCAHADEHVFGPTARPRLERPPSVGHPRLRSCWRFGITRHWICPRRQCCGSACGPHCVVYVDGGIHKPSKGGRQGDWRCNVMVFLLDFLVFLASMKGDARSGQTGFLHLSMF